jgi:hypothetical protein
MASASIAIDMVLDNAECDEVGRHHDNGDDEGNGCDERCEERAEPEPRARRKAMNARPVAMGWRIMTRVSAFEVSVEALLKVVPSI